MARLSQQSGTGAVGGRSEQVLRSKRGFIDVAIWIRMDQDLDARKCLKQLVLDLVHHAVGFGHCHAAIDPDVELHEIAVAAGPGAQIVQALEFGMLGDDRQKALALFERPLVIHQLLDGSLRCAPSAPAEPERDAESEQRVRTGKAEPVIERQRGDDGKIEHEVR